MSGHMDVLAAMDPYSDFARDYPFELETGLCDARVIVAALIEENWRLREIASAFLPVMEAARPLVLNLERLRDAAKATQP